MDYYVFKFGKTLWNAPDENTSFTSIKAVYEGAPENPVYITVSNQTCAGENKNIHSCKEIDTNILGAHQKNENVQTNYQTV